MNDPDFEILAAEATPIGMICLRQREIASAPGTFATEITLDHQFLMSSENTASERDLARRSLALHAGDGLRVLVGGLGLGYTAHEALRSSRVTCVDVVEFLPPVIDWMKRGLVPLAAELNADARLAVREGDVYGFLAAPPTTHYDLILVDVDHSPDERLGPASDSFYGREGLRAARRHLAPGGILAVWSYADSSPFEVALREVFADVRVEAVEFENVVVGNGETNWLFLASGARSEP
jgi:spermidine synthase